VPAEVTARRELEAKRKVELEHSRNRFEVAAPVPAEADPTKFPGGVVPTGLPPKRLGGRVATRRR
jgi:hypothetical protein